MGLRRICAGGAVAAAVLCQSVWLAVWVTDAAAQAVSPSVALPTDILMTAGDAARTQNFQGVVIYRDDRSLDAFRVVHRFKDGHESERVTSLNGEPRDIFREDDRVYCILPKDRRLSMMRPPPLKGFLRQITPDRLVELALWYEFKPLGSARVAARNCVGVAVMPRDKYRYGYELWADEQTHIPLKFSLLDSDRRVLEQVMFTEISFPASIPDEAFQTDVNTEQSRVVPRTDPPPLPLVPLLSLDGGGPQWNFERLPPGFRVVLHDEQEQPDGSGRASHTLLTDGLSTVSVYGEEVRRHGTELIGPYPMGSVQAYGLVVGSVHVTVVGDAPAATMRLIGDGLQPASAMPASAMPASAAPPAAADGEKPATP